MSVSNIVGPQGLKIPVRCKVCGLKEAIWADVLRTGLPVCHGKATELVPEPTKPKQEEKLMSIPESEKLVQSAISKVKDALVDLKISMHGSTNYRDARLADQALKIRLESVNNMEQSIEELKDVLDKYVVLR